MLNKLRKKVPGPIKSFYRIISNEMRWLIWFMRGKPVPPPHIVKQKTINRFQKRIKYNCFLETGTYLGDMIEAQRKHFELVYSIELSPYFYRNAVQRFKKNDNIGQMIKELMKLIKWPTVFWLDGHYSGENTAKGELNSPILSELKAILTQSCKHLILIDDARCFNGTNDYPDISELIAYILKLTKNHSVIIRDDIIQIIPC
jgi:hypothetical protein